MFMKYNTRLCKQSKLNEVYSKPNIVLVQDTSLCDKAPSTNIHNSRACVCGLLLLYTRPGPLSGIIMVTPSGIYSWGIRSWLDTGLDFGRLDLVGCGKEM